MTTTEELLRVIQTDDGAPLAVRRLREDDHDRLLEFGMALDQDDWLYLDIDLRTPATVTRLINAVEARNWRQLVAVDGDKIIGYANVRQMPGWKQHVGDIHLVVQGRSRGLGVGAVLASALIEVANELPLRKLSMQIIEEQHAGRAIFKKLGFRYEGLLEEHALDYLGNARNLVQLAYFLPSKQVTS